VVVQIPAVPVREAVVLEECKKQHQL